MEFDFAAIPAITAICYLAALIYKAVKTLDNRYIPSLCGVLGAALGAVAYASNMVGFPAQDYITAVAVGAVSGLAATGAHQVGKQLTLES